MSLEHANQEAKISPETHKVPDKRTMFELLKKGELGNTMPLWSVLEFRNYVQAQPFPKSISIRSVEGAKGVFIPNIHSLEELEAKLAELKRADCREEMLVIGGGVEDEDVVFSGDIMRGHDLYDLTYTEPGSEKHSSRDVRKTLKGLQAKALIELHMDDLSQTDLQRILDEYPDSVVEFSVLKRKAGILGRNTIIWEVRNY